MVAVVLAGRWVDRMNIKKDYFLLAKRADEQYQVQVAAATKIAKAWRSYYSRIWYRNIRYRSNFDIFHK